MIIPLTPGKQWVGEYLTQMFQPTITLYGPYFTLFLCGVNDKTRTIRYIIIMN
jgi:hypothetical protein